MTRPQGFSGADLEGAEGVRFSERRPVRFQDVDAAGIIFYPRVLEYFSDAYIAMLRAAGFDLPNELARGTLAMPLVHAEADYLHPLRFGDAVDVEIVGVRVGSRSFTVGYRVRLTSGQIASTGQTVHVCLDRATFKPVAVPEGMRAVLSGGALS